jgi:hypothetical protein
MIKLGTVPAEASFIWKVDVLTGYPHDGRVRKGDYTTRMKRSKSIQSTRIGHSMSIQCRPKHIGLEAYRTEQWRTILPLTRFVFQVRAHVLRFPTTSF